MICTYITTSDHDRIGFLENGIIVFHAFLILNLANNFDSFALFSQYFTNLDDIRRFTDKRRRNKIHTIPDSKLLNIHNILFRQCRQGHNHSGQIHILAFPNHGIIFNPARDLRRRGVDGQDGQYQTTIGHENLLARRDTRREFGVTTREFRGVAFERVIRCQNNRGALLERQLLVRNRVAKETGTDFGAFRVQHDGYLRVSESVRLTQQYQ